MKSKRKICVVTGSRSEFWLLYPLLHEIQRTNGISLDIVATGMHLSPEFGLTYRDIEDNGFSLCRKVEMLLSADSPSAISKSIGLATISFAEVWQELQPDLVLVLGDRFEIFASVAALVPFNIPVAHLHGGELTEGAMDDSFRHCITKLAHLHFTSTEEHRKRVIQLGEQPKNVFNVGAIGLDSIRMLNPFCKSELEAELDFALAKKNLVITYHPVTRDADSTETQFAGLLSALDELEDTHLIFTYPNADTYGRKIIEMIQDYVADNSNKAVSFVSLGQRRYLSLLKYVDGVVGNSSSGILEAPSFKIGTVNVGTRQRGRCLAESVIQCDPVRDSISAALKKLFSADFSKTLSCVENPYGNGKSSSKIMDVIASHDLKNLTQKHFFTIDSI